jgi:cytochrome c556
MCEADFLDVLKWRNWMKSLICGVSMLALVVMGGLASRQAGAADESTTPEVVMKKLFAGKTSANGILKAQLKGETPDWAKVKKAAETFTKYGPALGKNDPPRGEKASWDKLTKALADASKELDAAAKKEDLKKTNEVVKKIGASCKGCHEAHKPED